MDLDGHQGYCGGWKNAAVNLCQDSREDEDGEKKLSRVGL